MDQKFKSGQKNVTHEDGAGRPSTSINDEKIQQAREKVLANRRVAIDEVACSVHSKFKKKIKVRVQATGSAKVSRWQGNSSNTKLSVTYTVQKFKGHYN